jgi:preprotein translocase SecE subunit
MTGFILCALIAVDLGWTGAWGRLGAYFAADGVGARAQLVLGIIYAVLALAAIIAGLIAIGFHHRAVDFLIEVEQEMTKVEWPKTNHLVQATLVIAVAITILTLVILGVDLINASLLDKLLSLGDKI